MKSRTAIAALVVTGIAVAGALPVLAQQSNAPTPPKAEISGGAAAAGAPDRDGPGRDGMGRPDGMRGPAFLVAGCGDKAAERLEIALVRLAHRLDLTATQKPLFEAFKTAALDAQAKLEETCKADAPPKPDAGKPDILALLKSGLSVEEARLAAAKSVLPSFEALYASLTDAQKEAVLPHRGDDDGKGGKPGMGKPGKFGDHRNHDGMGAPGRNDAPPPAPAN